MLRIYSHLAMAAVFLLTGCVASVSAVKDYSGKLAPGDGVLVVAVDTMLPFSDLRLIRPNDTFAAIAASNLQTGRSVRFIEVPAGEYQWAKIDLNDNGYVHYYVALDQNKKERYTFTVKPGVINYPGDFVVTIDENRKVWVKAYLYQAINRYYIHQIDRTAMLLEDLSPDQATMVQRLGLVYTGPGNDDFLAYYNSLKSARKDAQ